MGYKMPDMIWRIYRVEGVINRFSNGECDGGLKSQDTCEQGRLFRFGERGGEKVV